ncbi:MAG: type I DNA topoisomerase [Clostridia bacterium]|nr:type I DNA topoisomerase [Clostridia bacterium]
MQLIIVESPTKAKTISKFLNKDYQVESSFGHIRDLPASKMGIDIENNFEPSYVIPDKSKKAVSTLKSAAKKAKSIILASDEDREGEAIAWHLAEILKIKPKDTKRIVFHEITKTAILKALTEPRKLNQNLVDAQQARRVLDRLVGYELSPFLWKKVAKGLSAGRVQSVAIRLIVEREREIENFKSEEYWTVGAIYKNNNEENYTANLLKIDNKNFNKLHLSEELANQVISDSKNSINKITKLEKKEISKTPAAPFTTSTLQQTANRYLGFSAKQTMTLAQKLYEQGYISYMRTDSFNLSPIFLKEAEEYLKESLGKDYILSSPRFFKSKNKNNQEAHEAIRPTVAKNTPDILKSKLEKGQHRLYTLIWQRSVATQMPAAKFNTTSIDTEMACTNKKTYIFRTNGQIMIFPGYLKIYPEKTSEEILPNIKKGETVNLKKITSEQHFTKGPARYSDAGLVKELEKHSIGRPSTYAPTIATIINRNYVERNTEKRLQATPISFIVNDLLVEHFPKIVDYNFTASLENSLDEIALGAKKWQPVIKKFYDEFHKNLEIKYENINKNDIMPEEKSEEKCDKCGAIMLIKTGRYGKFLACSAYPDCKNIKKMSGEKTNTQNDPALEELRNKFKGEVCNKCGADMIVRSGKYGPFLACSAYPKCKNIKNITDQDEPEIICPACKKGKIIKKFSKRGVFYACDAYPDCKNAYWAKPTGEKCPECDSLLINDKNKGIICSDKACGYTK